MPIYKIDETNSGGYRYILDSLYHKVVVAADDEDEAIRRFEAAYDVSWNYENSYDGGSCSCCGPRLDVYEIDYDDLTYMLESADYKVELLDRNVPTTPSRALRDFRDAVITALAAGLDRDVLINEIQEVE